MAFYMIRGSFSTASWKALVAKPQDRSIAIGQLCEQHGCTLHHYFFALGEHDVVVIMEAPDDKTAMALAMAVAASGSVTAVQTRQGRGW